MILDPLSVASTLGLFAGGWLFGRHARLKSNPKPPKPICMCRHHYGTHSPEHGECYASDKVDVNGKDQWVSCRCVRYTGPQPVESYWVPPAADMSIVLAPRVVEPISKGGPNG